MGGQKGGASPFSGPMTPCSRIAPPPLWRAISCGAPGLPRAAGRAWRTGEQLRRAVKKEGGSSLAEPREEVSAGPACLKHLRNCVCMRRASTANADRTRAHHVEALAPGFNCGFGLPVNEVSGSHLGQQAEEA